MDQSFSGRILLGVCPRNQLSWVLRHQRSFAIFVDGTDRRAMPNKISKFNWHRSSSMVYGNTNSLSNRSGKGLGRLTRAPLPASNYTSCDWAVFVATWRSLHHQPL